VLQMSGFKKFDEGKLEWELMPVEAEEEIIKVLQLGKNKYGDWNWLDNADEVQYSRYMNAFRRHYTRFRKGHDFDVETGLYELAHCIANLTFLLQYQIENVGIDTRRSKKLERELNQIALAKFKDE
jgi:hypothetical protein